MNIRFIDNMKRKYADYKAMSASETVSYTHLTTSKRKISA